MSDPQDDKTAQDATPCKCHQNFAYIAPRHGGHCCFFPASQSCHPDEVRLWERRKRNQEAS